MIELCLFEHQTPDDAEVVFRPESGPYAGQGLCRKHYEAAKTAGDIPSQNEWSGSPDPDDPDNYWIDDATGQRRKAPNGEIVEPCPELATQGIFTGPCVLDKEHDGPHQVG